MRPTPLRALSLALTLQLAACAAPTTPVGGAAVPGAAAPGAEAPPVAAPSAPAPASLATVELSGYAAMGPERLAGYTVEAFDALSGAPLPIVGAPAEAAEAGRATAYELRAGGAAAAPALTDGQGRFRLRLASAQRAAVVVMVSKGELRLRALVDTAAPPSELAVTAGSTVTAGMAQQLAGGLAAIQAAGNRAALKPAGYAVLNQLEGLDASLHADLLGYHAGLGAMGTGVEQRFGRPGAPHHTRYPQLFGNRSGDTPARVLGDLNQAIAIAAAAVATGTGAAEAIDPDAALAFLRQADPGLLPKLAWRSAQVLKAGDRDAAQALLDGQLTLNGRALTGPTGTSALVSKVFQVLTRHYPVQNGWLAQLAPAMAQRRVADLPNDLESSYAKNAIEDLMKAGILSPGGNGRFDPTGQINRQDFAIILAKALSLDTTAAPATATFSDVPTDHYAFAYVEAAQKAALLGDLGGGHFGDGTNLTREQMAVLFTRALNMPGLTFKASLPGTDMAVYAQDAVNNAIQLGLLNTRTGAQLPATGASDAAARAAVLKAAEAQLGFNRPTSASSGGGSAVAPPSKPRRAVPMAGNEPIDQGEAWPYTSDYRWAVTSCDVQITRADSNEPQVLSAVWDDGPDGTIVLRYLEQGAPPDADPVILAAFQLSSDPQRFVGASQAFDGSDPFETEPPSYYIDPEPAKVSGSAYPEATVRYTYLGPAGELNELFFCDVPEGDGTVRIFIGAILRMGTGNAAVTYRIEPSSEPDR